MRLIYNRRMSVSKNNELLPAYLVVGEDSLKREAVMKRLRVRLSELGDLAFNSDNLDGETALGGDVVMACNTVPFASEKRLVHVKNADKLKKADSEQIVSYLASPCASTVLALECEKLAKNTRLYKAVAAVGKSAVITCDPPKKRDLPARVRAMATAHGVVFTEAAAGKLVELAGEDTVRLDGEIAKIALAHRGTDPVNENEVISLVARTSEIKGWEFVNAFSDRDLPTCIRYLHLMSASPYSLLASCTSRIREMMCAQSLERRGAGAALASTLKLPDWRARNLKGYARKFTAAELRHALLTSRETERAMKSGADQQSAFLQWTVDTLKRTR